MTPARVLVADDHRMFAEGLRGLLEPEFELVEIVDDGRQLIEAAQRLAPDVIVVDITMPRLNGLDAAKHLRKAKCRAKIVFLTMHRDVTYLTTALQAGASAFLLKNSASSELLTAIREVMAGRTYITPLLVQRLAEMCAESDSESPTGLPALTLRQREVLQLFAEGRSAKQVAAALHISPRTAEKHKQHIMALLQVATTADLVQYAIRHGIVSQ
ncbi:MAG: response regulator [Thermoguttaceae bacterium]